MSEKLTQASHTLLPSRKLTLNRTFVYPWYCVQTCCFIHRRILPLISSTLIVDLRSCLQSKKLVQYCHTYQQRHWQANNFTVTTIFTCSTFLSFDLSQILRKVQIQSLWSTLYIYLLPLFLHSPNFFKYSWYPSQQSRKVKKHFETFTILASGCHLEVFY